MSWTQQQVPSVAGCVCNGWVVMKIAPPHPSSSQCDWAMKEEVILDKMPGDSPFLSVYLFNQIRLEEIAL